MVKLITRPLIKLRTREKCIEGIKTIKQRKFLPQKREKKLNFVSYKKERSTRITDLVMSQTNTHTKRERKHNIIK